MKAEWLDTLPSAIEELCRRWSLTLGNPIDSDEATCSWVAFATRSDGAHVVLKFGMPHMEGRDESAGLRYWSGEGMVRLLDFDVAHNALLLERCEPGSSLREQPETEQDVVIAALLERLWRPVPNPGFRPLAETIAFWSAETLAHEGD